MNADENIGIGHMMRTMTLAEEFLSHRYHISFITNSTFVYEKCKEKNIYCSYLEIKNENYEPELLRILNNKKINVLVFDLLENDLQKHAFVGKIDNILKVSLTIFPYKHKRFEDICIYPGLTSIEENIFKANTNQQIPYYSGPDYLILKDAFKFKCKKNIRHAADKVLITMGGADIGNFTKRVLDSISLLNIPIQCDVVIGKNFKNKKEIYDYAGSYYFTFHENIYDISELMFKNDIAIINGGTTRYELSVMGTPYIAISLHQTQFNITEILAKQNACINLGIGNDLKNIEIANSIMNLLNDYELRKNISQNMTQLFDTNGKHRIFNIIDSHLDT